MGPECRTARVYVCFINFIVQFDFYTFYTTRNVSSFYDIQNTASYFQHALLCKDVSKLNFYLIPSGGLGKGHVLNLPFVFNSLF